MSILYMKSADSINNAAQSSKMDQTFTKKVNNCNYDGRYQRMSVKVTDPETKHEYEIKYF